MFIVSSTFTKIYMASMKMYKYKVPIIVFSSEYFKTKT